MSEIIKNKYLDFGGLKKYDELIKGLIAADHKELADAIAALDVKLGSLEFEGSDDKSFAEVINDIYDAIADVVAAQDELGAKDVELEGKINSIIGDLESLEGSTLSEIAAKLTQHTTDIAGIEGRVATLEGTIEDLKNLGGENGLVAVVDKVNANMTAIETLNGEGEGSVKKAAADAQAAAEATAAEKATAAENAAKGYADSLDTAMDERVAKLEAIDHDQLVADAVAAVVAGAESDFDTLKEVAEWIASDTTGSAELQTTVSGHTESINTINGELDALELKVEGDITNLSTHIGEAAVKIQEVDNRLAALDAFVEAHDRIPDADINGLFGITTEE